MPYLRGFQTFCHTFCHNTHLFCRHHQRVIIGMIVMRNVTTGLLGIVSAFMCAFMIQFAYVNANSFVIAAVLFSFEIYCDFSGYSDIAIGTAKLMGINLMTNFKSPYFSQSIREFWSRWHISLSTWFRDYIYIPLGGNRVSKPRNRFNLMVTFLTSGLWHGANWTFVVWGGIHGLAQIVENQFASLRKKSSGFIWVCRVAFVFVFCTVAWVFFESNSLSDAGYIFSHMFSGITNPAAYLRGGFTELGIREDGLLILIFAVGLLAVYDYLSIKHDCIELVSRQKPAVRTVIYLLLLFIIITFKASKPAEFVYFQF